MRVIAGTAKGHRLRAPKGMTTRPALDQVKEAVFNILFRVEGEKVLDLFAGSGSVGIEALSRGARHCTFVERWKPAADCIERNLIHCKLEQEATVMIMDVFVALKKLATFSPQAFDLLFIDPPYNRALVNPTLEAIAKANIAKPQAYLVIEHHPKEPIQPHASFTLTDSRHYGQTAITFLQAHP